MGWLVASSVLTAAAYQADCQAAVGSMIQRSTGSGEAGLEAAIGFANRAQKGFLQAKGRRCALEANSKLGRTVDLDAKAVGRLSSTAPSTYTSQIELP